MPSSFLAPLRLRLLVALIALVAGLGGLATVASVQAAVPRHQPTLLAFRGGGFHLGGGGLFTRRSYGGNYRRYGRYGSRHPLVHRVTRTLFFAYVLHLFFSSGGASILLWLIIIVVVAHLFRRRRRRQYTY